MRAPQGRATLLTRASWWATQGDCILMCGVSQNNGLLPGYSIAVTSPSKDSPDASLSEILPPAYLAKQKKWGQPISVRVEHEGSGVSLQSLMGELLLKAGVWLLLSLWLCKAGALGCCPCESFWLRGLCFEKAATYIACRAPLPLAFLRQYRVTSKSSQGKQK